jgi:hypothetical protein
MRSIARAMGAKPLAPSKLRLPAELRRSVSKLSFIDAQRSSRSTGRSTARSQSSMACSTDRGTGRSTARTSMDDSFGWGSGWGSGFFGSPRSKEPSPRKSLAGAPSPGGKRVEGHPPEREFPVAGCLRRVAQSESPPVARALSVRGCSSKRLRDVLPHLCRGGSSGDCSGDNGALRSPVSECALAEVSNDDEPPRRGAPRLPTRAATLPRRVLGSASRFIARSERRAPRQPATGNDGNLPVSRLSRCTEASATSPEGKRRVWTAEL